MKIYSPIIDLQTTAYRLVVHSFADIDYSQAECILTDDEKIRFQTLSGKRQQEFAVSRIILYGILGEKYEPIRYTAEGKPYLPNTAISISHSKNYCAIIIGTSVEVGIDIEEYRIQIRHLAPRFMIETELQKFTTLQQQTLVWCAKEALFKMTNAGVDFRKHFSVQLITGNDSEGSITAEVKNENLHFSQELRYFCDEKFYLVWTSSKSK